ncbi:hypothetical protein AVEN_233328-1 [Araneus ventricosus]|uniref:Uncharacterized protein n=1 Tax=Araneus ventricosus TaxID=182803 RepID=A0A4Y2VHE1_ARAVE|nr:hypothetical protein AVEN_102934-1 [Araneus ventricosus]GBO24666.1 hypothetical protein AVEN_233328-1 [Araneus ventricosus]
MNAVSIPGSEELEVLSPSCIEIVQATVERKLGAKYTKSTAGQTSSRSSDLGDTIFGDRGAISDHGSELESAFQKCP